MRMKGCPGVCAAARLNSSASEWVKPFISPHTIRQPREPAAFLALAALLHRQRDRQGGPADFRPFGLCLPRWVVAPLVPIMKRFPLLLFTALWLPRSAAWAAGEPPRRAVPTGGAA